MKNFWIVLALVVVSGATAHADSLQINGPTSVRAGEMIQYQVTYLGDQCGPNPCGEMDVTASSIVSGPAQTYGAGSFAFAPNPNGFLQTVEIMATYTAASGKTLSAQLPVMVDSTPNMVYVTGPTAVLMGSASQFMATAAYQMYNVDITYGCQWRTMAGMMSASGVFYAPMLIGTDWVYCQFGSVNASFPISIFR